MDNKEQEKDIKSSKFYNDNDPNDYKLLVQKLKNIKDSLNLLEKNFLTKEI